MKSGVASVAGGRNRYVLFSCCGGCLLANGTVNKVSNINRTTRDNRKTPEFLQDAKTAGIEKQPQCPEQEPREDNSETYKHYLDVRLLLILKFFTTLRAIQCTVTALALTVFAPSFRHHIHLQFVSATAKRQPPAKELLSHQFQLH
jgi:hypothetical protein